MDRWIFIPMLLPVIVGIVLLLSSFLEHLRVTNRMVRTDGRALPDEDNLKELHILVGAVLVISAVLTLAAAWTGEKSVILFYLTKNIPVCFRVDAVGSLFATIVSIVWIAAGIYAFVYMKHVGEQKRYFGFYLIAFGVLAALSFAGNLVTLYFFYELLTLVSMPLVLHNGSREAIMAGLKYLFYSMCGAYMGLFGIFVLNRYCNLGVFTAGGSLNLNLVGGHGTLVLTAVFIMIVGFAAKAGMFPMHAWLPTAHPQAPAPASAVLSGVIVKAGVLAILRAVYYVVGPDFIRGTWVQTTWIVLALFTVFMGSLLAYREQELKKRLAYSTVSNLSYILFGLFLMTPTAVAGALLHTVFHAFAKSALFLTAGIFIYQNGKTKVTEYRGIGCQMPVTLWCYTIASLALIGIPPTSGFISKWYLALGALESNVGGLRYTGPVILLISAFLTAGYLLPITLRGFFPGKEYEGNRREIKEADKKMLIPLLALALLSLLPGVFPNPLVHYVLKIAGSVL